MASATTGTGTLTLGSAVLAALTFDEAGITNGQVVSYAIEDYDVDGNVIAREVGRGTYTASGTTLARTEVYDSTDAGAAINCTGRQHVFITALKEDFNSLLTSAAAASTYQPLDSDLTTLAANITAFGHSLVDDANAGAARTTLGLGTMAVETATDYLTTAAAAAGYQPLDADLTTWAGLTPSANAQSLVTAANYAAMRALLDLEAGTDFYSIAAADAAFLSPAEGNAAYQPLDADLTTIAANITAAGHAILDDADASAQRTTLGLGTAAVKNTGTSGNNVPLLDAQNTWSENQLIVKASANFNVVASSGDATQYVAAISGQAATLRFTHWTGAAVSDRWLFGKDATAESGANAGSNLAMYRYDDSGAFLGTLFTASRADGSVNWRGGLYSNGVTGGSQGNGTINFGTIYEGGTSLAAKYQPLDADLTTIAGLGDPGADRLLFWDDSAGAFAYLTLGTNLSITGTTINASGGGSLSDGDYGDITVGSGGTTLTIDNDVVTYAKMQNVTANSVLARAAGTDGDVSAVALSASQLLGRGASGDVAAITLGTNLSMSGTTLNASGGGITRGQAVASQSMMAMN